MVARGGGASTNQATTTPSISRTEGDAACRGGFQTRLAPKRCPARAGHTNLPPTPPQHPTDPLIPSPLMGEGQGEGERVATGRYHASNQAAQIRRETQQPKRHRSLPFLIISILVQKPQYFYVQIRLNTRLPNLDNKTKFTYLSFT